MERPLFQARITDLEALFERSRTDHAALEELSRELKHRSVDSAGVAVKGSAGARRHSEDAFDRLDVSLTAGGRKNKSSSKWVNIVGDRDLTQQHLTDQVRGLDLIREDRSLACAPGRQRPGKGFVVELDAHDEGR